MSHYPQHIAELQDIVRGSSGRLLPRGGGTKPALSSPPSQTEIIELADLAGIIEYEPGEFTFTAYAGTRVIDVVSELAQHGQYLPFDPLFVEGGATLGGTVAANTAGSGRYRYGGVRDFILGVRFVDGQGQLVRSGGKVVKNAAGFDLPKFMVGSMGRYGIMAELSFKVFPQPPLYTTLKLFYPSVADALSATYHLSAASFELDAVDLEPGAEEGCALLIRVGGLAASLPQRIERLRSFLAEKTQAADSTTLEDAADHELWRRVNNAHWAGGAALVKVPLSPRQVTELDNAVLSSVRRYTCAGHIAWIAASDISALVAALDRLNLTGLQLTGTTTETIIGSRQGLLLAQRVKQALDPASLFGEA
jgi:glycolate oxidase FAD binding subunit